MGKDAGFTLIELMLSIAIMSILLAIATPSMSRMIELSRVRGAAATALADIRQAQSEAQKRGVPVEATISAGGSWSYSLGTEPPRKIGSERFHGIVMAIHPGIQPTSAPNDRLVFTPKRNALYIGASEMPANTLIIRFDSLPGSPDNQSLGLMAGTSSSVQICSPSANPSDETTGHLNGYPVCPPFPVIP